MINNINNPLGGSVFRPTTAIAPRPVVSVRVNDREPVTEDVFLAAGAISGEKTGTPAKSGIPIIDQLASELAATEKTARTECRTCAERRYVDRSNDSGVSFQTPTKIAPVAAAAAVTSHEMEHVSREKGFAERDDREIVSSTVTLKFRRCPECGRTYVAGGETRTVSRKKSAEESPFKSKNAKDGDSSAGRLEG